MRCSIVVSVLLLSLLTNSAPLFAQDSTELWTPPDKPVLVRTVNPYKLDTSEYAAVMRRLSVPYSLEKNRYHISARAISTDSLMAIVSRNRLEFVEGRSELSDGRLKYAIRGNVSILATFGGDSVMNLVLTHSANERSDVDSIFRSVADDLSRLLDSKISEKVNLISNRGFPLQNEWFTPEGQKCILLFGINGANNLHETTLSILSLYQR